MIHYICSFLLRDVFFFFFSSRRRHTRWNCDWSSDVCSSDLDAAQRPAVDSDERRQVRCAGHRTSHPQRTRTRRPGVSRDRKSTRLNSSHSSISYAVFCLKKKKKKNSLLSNKIMLH